MHHTRHQKFLIDSVAICTLQSWSCTIRLATVCPLNERLQDHHLPVKMHCRTPCINGCRKGTATITRQKYMRLFSSGRIKQYCSEVLFWALTFMKYLQIFRCRLSTVCRDVIAFCMKYIRLKRLQFIRTDKILRCFPSNNIHIQFICGGCAHLQEQPQPRWHFVSEVNTVQCLQFIHYILVQAYAAS